MDGLFKENLDSLMDRYSRKRSDPPDQRLAQKAPEDVFLQDFIRFREKTAYPLLERVGNYLRLRGHRFEILRQEYEVDHDGKSTEASLSIVFYPAGVPLNRYRRHEFPAFSIFAIRSRQRVLLHGSNRIPPEGGSAGPRGEFRLEELTVDRLQSELLKLLGEVFGR